MTLNYETVIRTRNSEYMRVITTWHQLSLDAYRNYLAMASAIVPGMNLYRELPTAAQDVLGDPEAIMDHDYGFVLAVLALQRDFVQEVFRSSPLAPPLVAPAR